MTRFTISAAALALALATSGVARAETMSVRIGDLNLQSEVGAKAALSRIHAAAATFCGGDGARDLGVIAQQRACVARMSGQAVDRLGAPRVSALNSPAAAAQLASLGR